MSLRPSSAAKIDSASARRSRLLVAITGSICVLALGGCATSRSGSVYTHEQARQELTVRTGIVESVRGVQLEGSRSGAGTFAGGAIGGVAGSNVGGGKGQIVGAIVGAVAGAVAGNAIENSATRKNGVEITVKLDNGHLIAIVQEDDERFMPGERVRVLSGRGETRVSH